MDKVDTLELPDVDLEAAKNSYKTPRERRFEDLKRSIRYWSREENKNTPEGSAQLTKYQGQLKKEFGLIYKPRSKKKLSEAK
jgi:hypothetical protein